jgi:hypothetical protein
MRSPDPTVVHSDDFGAEYEAELTPPKSGYYTDSLIGAKLRYALLEWAAVSHQQRIGRGFHSTSLEIYFDAGAAYPLRVSYHAGVWDAALHLEWSLPRTAKELDAEVRDASPKLRKRRRGYLCRRLESRSRHRGSRSTEHGLPGVGRRELIRRVANLNPHTVVVLTAWIAFHRVLGWIECCAGYSMHGIPGMEGGTAIAEALVGDINPAGKLTFSWPKQLKDSPTYSIGTADKDNVNYKEGIFVGYRYFDTHNVTPQFPFGFGLNYSDFTYSGLTIVRTTSQGFHVSLNVKNTLAARWALK